MLVLGFLAVERFPEHLGPISELTALRVVQGPVSHIRDGDTIEVAGTPIRFGSLDCAERGTPAGQVATERLRELIAGQSLTCAVCAVSAPLILRLQPACLPLGLGTVSSSGSPGRGHFEGMRRCV